MKTIKELVNKNMKTIKELVNKRMKTLKEKYYYSIIFLSSAIERSMRAVYAVSCAHIDSIYFTVFYWFGLGSCCSCSGSC